MFVSLTRSPTRASARKTLACASSGLAATIETGMVRNLQRQRGLSCHDLRAIAGWVVEVAETIAAGGRARFVDACAGASHACHQRIELLQRHAERQVARVW